MKVLLTLTLIAGRLAAQELALGKGVNLFSLEEEVKLGREAAFEFRGSARIVETPQAGAYLDALARDLSRQFAPQHEFKISVFDDRQLFFPIRDAMPSAHDQRASSEAIAVSDGSIFVPLTLLKRLGSEAGVVKMVAHALAHIADRHCTRFMTRSRLVESAAGEMPEHLRRQHTLAVSQTATQDRKGFEKRAEDWAARWAVQVAERPSAFTALRDEIGRF